MIPVIVPAAQQALTVPDVRPCRPDERTQGDAAVERELAVGIADFEEGSHLRELLLDSPGAVGNAVDLFLDESRTVRMLVAVDQAHELGFGGGRAVGADMKLYGVTGLYRDLVCVTEYLDLRHGAEFPIEELDAALTPSSALQS
jgi:hypothetical protein